MIIVHQSSLDNKSPCVGASYQDTSQPVTAPVDFQLMESCPDEKRLTIREANRFRRIAEQIERESASYRDVVWAELNYLRMRLPHGFVTKYCMYGLRGDHSTGSLTYNDKTGKARFDGLHSCGSVWVCPLCVENITAQRRAELKTLLAQTKYRVCMVTFTIHHERTDRLAAQVDNLNRAVRKMKSHRAWRRFSAKWGLLGHVHCLEVTHGQNGWHTHRHEMFVLDPAVVTNQDGSAKQRLETEMQADLYRMYQHELGKLGLSCDQDHGVVVSAHRREYGAYISKWGISEELTRQTTKQASSGGKSVWLLLREAATGNEYSWSLFLEYCYAFRGKKQLHWSKGLRALLALPVAEQTDGELADQVVDSQESTRVVIAFSWQAAYYLSEKGLHGPLLNFCERVQGDSEQVAAYLARMGLRRYVLIPLGIRVNLPPPKRPPDTS